MKQGSAVSILIPVYNRQEIVGRAICSALNQTYNNMEVIVVDNASTDGTWEEISKFAQKYSIIKAFRNERNIGPVRNWKKCLEYASGEIVKFVWSDDWIDDNFIDEATKYFENEEIAFVFSPAMIVNQNCDVHRKVYEIRQKPSIIDREEFIEQSLFGRGVPVSPGCAVFRRKDALESLMIDVPNDEGLDFSQFGAGNDLLLMLLPLINRRKIAFTNLTSAYFLHHEGSFSVSNNLSAYYEWAKLYFLKQLGDKRLLNCFRTKNELKRFVGRGNRKICRAIPGRISLSFGAKLIMNHLRASSSYRTSSGCK